MSNVFTVPTQDDDRILGWPVAGILCTVGSADGVGRSTHMIIKFMLTDGTLSEGYSFPREGIPDICQAIMATVEAMEARDKTL